MSWKMTGEVREARLAGQLPGLESTTFLVLFVMADTCRGESRIASISVTELATLSGLDRTTIWRAIKRLVALDYVKKLGRSNQYQTARFDVLPGARCADATCTEAEARCADATYTEGVHVASEGVHVASDGVHVANQASARCTSATLPDIPDNIPDEHSRGERAHERGAPPPTAQLVPIAESVAATPINPFAPKPFCDLHPQREDPKCPACWDRAKYLKWWQENTQEGLAHQREVAVHRAGTWINSKGEASDRTLIAGKTRLERVLNVIADHPSPRPVASERLRAIDAEIVPEIDAPPSDELPPTGSDGPRPRDLGGQP